MKQYLRCNLHDNHPTMTDHTPGVPMPKAMINHPNAVKLLDLDNPNDNAFKLVIIFVFCCDVIFSGKKTQYLALILPTPTTHFALTHRQKRQMTDWAADGGVGDTTTTLNGGRQPLLFIDVLRGRLHRHRRCRCRRPYPRQTPTVERRTDIATARQRQGWPIGRQAQPMLPPPPSRPQGQGRVICSWQGRSTPGTTPLLRCCRQRRPQSSCC